VLTVAPIESDAARIVTENDCGIAVDPDDPQSVADAIVQLRSNPLRLEAMGKRAREAASRYTRAAELQRFVGVLEEVARETNGGRHLES
jgi:glycosyltransferase involved in cell wall biosynthesis